MATTNGDVQIETAQSFARDYLDDLFANNRNLGAFEEETLDINIKSKYDDLDDEEESEEVKKQEESSSSSSDSEEETHATHNATFSAPVHEEEDEEERAESPLEPGHQAFQVNGHSEVEVEVASHNGGHHGLNGDVLEPNHSEFTSHSEFSHSDVIEPEQSQFRYEGEQPAAHQVSAEEEEEADDVVAPIPSSRAKTPEETEDEIAEMKFQKLGVTKDWWDTKRKESDTQKDNQDPVDKFKTIKQNIRKGNTRSLLARFENLSKVSE